MFKRQNIKSYLPLFLSLRRQRRRLLGSTFVVVFCSASPLSKILSCLPRFLIFCVVVVVCYLSQKVLKVDSDLIDFNRDFKKVIRDLRKVDRDLIEVNRDLVEVNRNLIQV